MKSYWEEIPFFTEATSFVRSGFSCSTYDFLVIGGGIIGTSTAIELAERHPSATIALMERSIPPRGASTRNAGFACFGSLSEITHDIDLMGADLARDLVRRRLEGLTLLRDRCGDTAIGFEQCGGTEVFTDDHPALGRLNEINAILEPLFHVPAFTRCDDRIEEAGFKGINAITHTHFEGALHSGRLIERLWSLASGLGIEIVQASECTVDAGVTIWATNALDAPGGDTFNIVPSRGQILVTEQFPEPLAIRGTYHMDEGFVYFREVDNRVLLGGGRNIAMEEEATREFEITDKIQGFLEHLLRTVIVPGTDIGISHRWSGIMGFSPTKQPVIEEVSPGIIRAFGCNGMGVALGASIARDAAELASAR